MGLDHAIPLLVGQRRGSGQRLGLASLHPRRHVGHAALADLGAVVDDARVVHEHVDAPVLGDRAVDGGGERRGIGDVERSRLTADVGGDLRGGVRLEVVHDHVRAISREPPADRRSQS